jgi:hypothetical protein
MDMETKLHILAASHVDHLNFMSQEDREKTLALVCDKWPSYLQVSSNRLGPWIFMLDLGFDMPCDLIGPTTGFPPVDESQVQYRVRPGRKCATRFVSATPTSTTKLTVVVGPYAGIPCVLYTVYSGPQAPREPGDTSIATWDELEFSRQFWKEHALTG